LIPIQNPLVFDGNRFSPITLEQLVNSKTYGKTALNPSQTYAKMGIYLPRLTMFKRPSKLGPVYQLAIEFSAPKMLFNNNFDELTQDDFEKLLTALQKGVFELLGYKFFKTQFAHAEVGSWHPSKNIVFLNYTSCQTILNTIAKLDISKIYDLQKTDFRDGHVLHIHCNSLDIAFYDKMADLRKSKTSEKRAFETSNQVQQNLLEKLEEYKPMEVFRYELRFVGKASIKRAFPQVEKHCFENLFKEDLCRDILLKHWKKICRTVDMLALDIKQPYELLQNYLEENNETPQAALAAVTGLLIISQVGVSGLRNTLEARYGKQVWYRVKPLLKSPSSYRFQYFQRIDETLASFRPTKIAEYITNIENSVNLW